VGDHCSALNWIEINADRPGPCLILSRSNPEFVPPCLSGKFRKYRRTWCRSKRLPGTGYRTKSPFTATIPE